MDKIIFSLLILLPIANGGVTPGAFFWKPRLSLDLQVPTDDNIVSSSVHEPNKENVKIGMVVLVNSYQAGISVISLAAGLTSGFGMYPHLNPFSAYFYNDAYRWLLRYINLVPFWIGSGRISFCDTTRTWHRRFYYMDEVMPKWLRYLFPYVKKQEWEQEENNNRKFKKYSLSAFGKYFRYPSKKFNNFKSFETEESFEGAIISSQSID